MKLGVWNNLRLDRFTSPGAYLEDEDGNDVLLPNRYVEESFKLDDIISVFLYKDSEDRIVATTRKPLIQLGQFAYLKVREINPFGAFMDWGLEKDLLVPFREQPKQFEDNRYYLVFMYLDTATERLAATARVNEFYESAFEVLEKGQEVDLLICENTDLGVKCIANHRYRGLIFESDIQGNVKIGDRVKGYIKNVREDGKLDIVLQPEGYQKVEPLSQELLDLIAQHDGFLPLTDKSDPEEVKRLTGWSKKTFKQVLGKLYKDRLVELSENGVNTVQP